MGIGLVIVIVVLLALSLAFVAFWRYSRTQAWSRSDTRAAALGFLISIAPFFGGRVQPPKPEVPVAMTPGPEQDDRLRDVTTERVGGEARH
jgi:hypothetical protein